jgi:hypothetical protein
MTLLITFVLAILVVMGEVRSAPHGAGVRASVFVSGPLREDE